jgi:uridine phosphorylase
MTYPILEYHPARQAYIEPSKVIRPRDMPEHCVICYFREVLEKVVSEHGASMLVENSWEDGPHPVYEITCQDRRLAFYHPGVGAPLTSALLEEVIAFGCSKFMVCGGCGVLEKDIALGHLIVVSEALRDEGVSYHYLPPARAVKAHPLGVASLESTLKHHAIPYRLGKTWTTDAPYRETSDRIAKRRAEGCIVVEMEAAGMMAVAEFRGAKLGVVLYGGDDLSGTEWDNRNWQSQADIRQGLFWLAAEACLGL